MKDGQTLERWASAALAERLPQAPARLQPLCHMARAASAALPSPSPDELRATAALLAARQTSAGQWGLMLSAAVRAGVEPPGPALAAVTSRVHAPPPEATAAQIGLMLLGICAVATQRSIWLRAASSVADHCLASLVGASGLAGSAGRGSTEDSILLGWALCVTGARIGRPTLESRGRAMLRTVAALCGARPEWPDTIDIRRGRVRDWHTPPAHTQFGIAPLAFSAADTSARPTRMPTSAQARMRALGRVPPTPKPPSTRRRRRRARSPSATHTETMAWLTWAAAAGAITDPTRPTR